MKQITSLLLTCLLCFALTGCDKKEDDEGSTYDSPEEEALHNALDAETEKTELKRSNHMPMAVVDAPDGYVVERGNSLVWHDEKLASKMPRFSFNGHDDDPQTLMPAAKFVDEEVEDGRDKSPPYAFWISEDRLHGQLLPEGMSYTCRADYHGDHQDVAVELIKKVCGSMRKP